MTFTKSISRRVSRIPTLLGLQQNTIGMLAMVVLVGFGEKMAERFLPIYIMAIGGGAVAVGFLRAMDNLLSGLYSFLGGYFSDRFGIKRSLLVFNIVAIFGFGIVIVIPTWRALLVGAVFFISWSAISMPVTMSLMYRVLPQNKHTMGVTMNSLVRRIPMALGPIAGGFFIAMWGERDGVRMAFVVALILAVVALMLQQRLIQDDEPASKSHDVAGNLSPKRNPLKLWRLMSQSMKRLLIADILVRFCEQIPYAFVVIWCMKTIGEPVSAVQFSFLTAIEMATAVIVYIPVAYMADRGAKNPFILVTFIFFTFFPLVLLYSRSFDWLIVAFILRGLKEFGEPTRKSLIMDLAPQRYKAGMFGLYYLIRDSIASVATLGGAFLWQIDPKINLITAFAFGIIGTLGFAIFGREIKSDVPSRA